MAISYTAGFWTAKEGEEETFIEAWREFAEWASGFAGVRALHLLRDVKEPRRYVSYADWDDIDAIHGWKGSEQFKERIGAVKRHTDEFTAAELELVTRVEARTYAER